MNLFKSYDENGASFRLQQLLTVCDQHINTISFLMVFFSYSHRVLYSGYLRIFIPPELEMVKCCNNNNKRRRWRGKEGFFALSRILI